MKSLKPPNLCIFTVGLFMLLGSFGLWAEERSHAPDDSFLQSYRDKQAYQYEQKPPEERNYNFIQDLLYRLYQLMQDMGEASPVFKWIFYALMALIVAFAIYKVAQMDNLRFTKKKKDAASSTSWTEADIHEIDFEQAIQQAEAAKDWVHALRLRYLKSLKHLSDLDRIEWKAAKTNRHYADELQNTILGPSFNALSRLYERVVYSNQEFNYQDYEKARNQFTAFERQSAQQPAPAGT